eukprot:6185285-Pleurochrysis_carterae.AAC.2
MVATSRNQINEFDSSQVHSVSRACSRYVSVEKSHRPTLSSESSKQHLVNICGASTKRGIRAVRADHVSWASFNGTAAAHNPTGHPRDTKKSRGDGSRI